MEKGQGYISQKLVFTSVAYAVTDNVTILGGTFTLFPPALSVLGGKYSIKVNDMLHLGFGGEVFIIGFDSTLQVGIGFASATFGNSDKHITVASGYLYDNDMGFTRSGSGLPIMIAGHNRFSDRGAFITENWILLDPVSEERNFVALINSVAFRIIGKRDSKGNKRAMKFTKEGYPRSTWDLGFVMMHVVDTPSLFDPTTNSETTSTFNGITNVGPMPWIDYAWHFGPASRNTK
jgi:hypothetical protein